MKTSKIIAQQENLETSMNQLESKFQNLMSKIEQSKENMTEQRQIFEEGRKEQNEDFPQEREQEIPQINLQIQPMPHPLNDLPQHKEEDNNNDFSL